MGLCCIQNNWQHYQLSYEVVRRPLAKFYLFFLCCSFLYATKIDNLRRRKKLKNENEPKNDDNHKKEDIPKNYDDFKPEHDPKNEKDPKKEDKFKSKDNPKIKDCL